MSSDRCLCCSVHQSAIIAGNYFILAYGIALGVTVWWIIQAQGKVVIGAYILLGLYFLTFIISIVLVLSLAVQVRRRGKFVDKNGSRGFFLQKRPSVLFIWMLVICIFFLPECGLNLWVCIWALGVGTAKGLGFLIFYAARAVINIICILCVYFAYNSWKAEKRASKRRIASAYASSAYAYSSQPPFHVWNYNPHFPYNAFQSQQFAYMKTDYGVSPYYSMNFGSTEPVAGQASPRLRRTAPVAAGLLVRHRVNDQRHKKDAATETGPMDELIDEPGTSETAQRRHGTDQKSDDRHRPMVSDQNKSDGRIPSMPVPAVYLVDPWRLNYPPPFWPSSTQRIPQAFDSYTPAPLSASALAFSAPAYPTQSGRMPTYFQSPPTQQPIQQSNISQWPGGIAPMRNFNTATGLYELPKNPIPPGTTFDARGSDVEPSFGNFIMRQKRTGDLGTFRPKTLRAVDENKRMNENTFKFEERAKPRTDHPTQTHEPIPAPRRDESDRQSYAIYNGDRNNRSQRNLPRLDESGRFQHYRNPRVMTTKHTQMKKQSRDGRKMTTTTTLMSSSYYRYHTSAAHRPRPPAAIDSGAESIIYGHTPVRLDDTTWTVM